MLSRVELRNKILNQSIINKNQVIASDQEREYTWFELMELAKVFRRLIDSREYKSKFICFFAERNVSSVAIMVACILGDEIFVPIDHEQPRERVLKILEKVGVDSIIEPSLIGFKSDFQNTTRVKVLTSTKKTATGIAKKRKETDKKDDENPNENPNEQNKGSKRRSA